MTENIDFVFKNNIIYLTQSAGFFSCCSVRLDSIIQYYNIYNKLPEIIDSTNQFKLYKLKGQENIDITNNYFINSDINKINITELPKLILYKENFQGKNYKNIDYKNIIPFVNKYFSPSNEILNASSYITEKYDLNYKNICVLFYRGLDKITEFSIPSYRDVLIKARELQEQNPDIKFVIQSDETDFINAALLEFPNAIVFRDETRSVYRQITSVDLIYQEKNENYYYSKLFLAIVLIMSKCKYVICNTGNISLWICLYRGNSNNVFQYLNYEYVDSPNFF